MTNKHLEYFMMAFRYQNLTLAANELFVSRQALSKMIREMEQELGKKLFTRSKTGITPTDEAIRIARHADVILDEYDKLTNTKPVTNHKYFEINVYTFDDVMDYLTPDFVYEFSVRNPNTLLHFIEGTDVAARDNLLLHRCDFSIVPDSIDISQFESYLLFHSQYGIIINKSNPLSDKEVISFEDLQTQKVIGKNRDLLYYQQDLSFITRSGCDVDFIAEVSNNFIARELVKRNLGVAFAWNYAIDLYITDELVFRPLLRQDWGRSIFLVHNSRTELSPQLKAFRDFLLDWVEKHRLHA